MDILLLTINPTVAVIEQIQIISLYLLPFILCILCIQHRKTIQHIWTTRKQITGVNSFLDKFSPVLSTTGKYFLLGIFLCFFSRFCSSRILNLGSLHQPENVSVQSGRVNIPAKQEMESFITEGWIPAEKIERFSTSNDRDNRYVSIRSTINYGLGILAIWISGILSLGGFFFLISCGNTFLRNVGRFFVTAALLMTFIGLFLTINEQQLSV